MRDYLWLGLWLGFGLLTKAFYLPIIAGVTLFVALRREWARLLAMLTVAAPIGGHWYLHNLMTTGVLTGGGEQIWLAHNGGLLSNLLQRFHWGGFIRGVSAIVATTVWGGTYSLARFNEVFLAPLSALLMAGLAANVAVAYRTRLGHIVWAPLCILAMFGGGLVHHVLVALAMTGIGANTPGWYLHIIAGPLSFAFALGVLSLLKWRPMRPALAALAAYTLCFFAVVTWVQIAMYAGCAAKLGANKHYVFPDGISCLLDARTLLANLDQLAQPSVGLPLFYGGFSLGVILLILLANHLRRGDTTGSPSNAAIFP
jgi:hypothetical protein